MCSNTSAKRMRSNRRILLMVTSDKSVNFYQGFAKYLRHNGWEVHISAAPPLVNLTRIAENEDVIPHSLPMRRGVTPLRDVVAWVRARRLMRQVKPSLVVASTPKAGLIGMLAASAWPSAVRVYQLRGLRLETTRGLTRAMLVQTERVACGVADTVLAISKSLRDETIRLKLTHERKVVVAGSGSSNGVHIERFANPSSVAKISLSDQSGGPVLGFVGRMAHDKGLTLLAESLKILRHENLCGTLLLLGADDSPHSRALREMLDETGWKIHHMGYVEDVERYYPLMDIVCFPTLREGFGNVIIEAGAAGKPVVATLATGVKDAIVDGVTGLIVRERDPHAYAEAIIRLYSDPSLRSAMGHAAYERVNRLYRREYVWQVSEALYLELLNSGVPRMNS